MLVYSLSLVCDYDNKSHGLSFCISEWPGKGFGSALFVSLWLLQQSSWSVILQSRPGPVTFKCAAGLKAWLPDPVTYPGASTVTYTCADDGNFYGPDDEIVTNLFGCSARKWNQQPTFRILQIDTLKKAKVTFLLTRRKRAMEWASCVSLSLELKRMETNSCMNEVVYSSE